IIAHPESEEHILKVANYIGSTAGMLKYVINSDHDTFIVATEGGILYEMQQAAPHKTLIPAPAKEDNTCACSECAFMKMNTLQKLHDCLEQETPEINLEKTLMEKAYRPIQRMLELSI
ncbi:MAG: quinolinate synthase NadA, partial [Salegentibacter sp.]